MHFIEDAFKVGDIVTLKNRLMPNVLPAIKPPSKYLMYTIDVVKYFKVPGIPIGDVKEKTYQNVLYEFLNSYPTFNGHVTQELTYPPSTKLDSIGRIDIDIFNEVAIEVKLIKKDTPDKITKIANLIGQAIKYSSIYGPNVIPVIFTEGFDTTNIQRFAKHIRTLISETTRYQSILQIFSEEQFIIK